MYVTDGCLLLCSESLYLTSHMHSLCITSTIRKLKISAEKVKHVYFFVLAGKPTIGELLSSELRELLTPYIDTDMLHCNRKIITQGLVIYNVILK